jgi:hypothetical protein
MASPAPAPPYRPIRARARSVLRCSLSSQSASAVSPPGAVRVSDLHFSTREPSGPGLTALPPALPESSFVHDDVLEDEGLHGPTGGAVNVSCCVATPAELAACAEVAPALPGHQATNDPSATVACTLLRSDRTSVTPVTPETTCPCTNVYGCPPLVTRKRGSASSTPRATSRPCRSCSATARSRRPATCTPTGTSTSSRQRWPKCWQTSLSESFQSSPPTKARVYWAFGGFMETVGIEPTSAIA